MILQGPEQGPLYCRIELYRVRRRRSPPRPGFYNPSMNGYGTVSYLLTGVRSHSRTVPSLP
jgi:hypothetical protein